MIRKTTRYVALTAALLAPHASLALAQDSDDALTISANVGYFSDYRFRGVSLSDEDFALQGGIDIGHSSGFYVGSWGSSIESFNGSELELDIYCGYATEVSGTSLDLGVLAYTFPGGYYAAYYDLYNSASRTVGSIDMGVGFAYIPSQDNVGNQDNIYIYGDLGYAIPEMPVSVAAHLGYEDGAFGDKRTHWSLGVTYEFKSLAFNATYVDTSENGAGFDSTIVFGVSASF